MRRANAGFTLIETMMVMAVAGTLAAVSVASIGGSMRHYALSGTTQTVAAEIRAARATAISANRTLRVRFNCPGPGQFRIVEVVNDPAIDTAADRCSGTTYPFPDPNPAVRPNADGPARWLSGAQFGGFQDLEVTNRGRIKALIGCPLNCAAAPLPATIALTDGYETQTITVAAGGRIQIH